MNGQEGQAAKTSINANTGVSIGLVVIVVAGFLAVMKGQTDTKNELSNQLDKLNMRVSSLESAKNSWSAVDMFKWAVHLQQSNPQIKVPEPEVAK